MKPVWYLDFKFPSRSKFRQFLHQRYLKGRQRPYVGIKLFVFIEECDKYKPAMWFWEV